MKKIFLTKNRMNRLTIILMVSLCIAFAAIPAAAVSAAAESAVTEAAASAAAARRTRAPRISLDDAVATAEKMYYCGELYIFLDSMIKINYEMASIAENINDSLQSGALTRGRTKLNTLMQKYNRISETYNSWVDVKADLEFYIDIIGTRNAISKSQLQAAYRRTLLTINETRVLLDAAAEYYGDQSADNKRELTNSADKLVVTAANAVTIMAPLAQMTINGYRGMFDLFASQAGIELEYKTWQNPETGIPE